MNSLPIDSLYDLIVAELLEKKSLSALIYLIDRGRELDFSVYGEKLFVSRNGAEKYVSLWVNADEYSFDSVEELIENAVIKDKPFSSVWQNVEIEALL